MKRKFVVEWHVASLQLGNSIFTVANDIINEVGSFQTLEQAMLWALARKPPATLKNVVTQDEFTHDVVIEVSTAEFLVFDTT
jgi:hypothetical protein